jgi:hypothetical protein
MSSPNRPRTAPWLLATGGVALAYGGLALLLGQDANWDLRNYHYYNPYAFLTGRRDFDLAPAHVATFYNPLLHLPFYALAGHAPPRVTGFVLGVVQGLNFLPLCYLSYVTLLPARWRGLAAGALAAAGLLGAMTFSEVGTTYGDNVLSLFVLGGLALLVSAGEPLAGGRGRGALARVGLAGLLVGAAAGMKLPMAVYAVGFAIACLTLPGGRARGLGIAIAFGAGTALGFLATDGFWLLDLWQRYGNPLFPYYNHVFRSPMGALADYKDPRFVPDTWTARLLFPYRVSFAPYAAAEVRLFDLRPAALYTLLLVWLGLAAAGRGARSEAVGPPLTRHGPARLVVVALSVSWLVWMCIFGIQRYFVPGEMLMPLAILLVADRLPLARRTRAIGAAAVLVAVTLVVVPARWERVPWGEDYFGVQVPALSDPDHTLVLLAGTDATAYLIPSFPPAVRFVRIQGYFTGPTSSPNGYDRLIAEVVRGHVGPTFAIFREHQDNAVAAAALAFHGLRARLADCRVLHTWIDQGLPDRLQFCPVERAPGSPAPGGDEVL